VRPWKSSIGSPAGRKLLDIAVAQGEAEIEPYRVLDDLGREMTYALAMPGLFYRSTDGLQDFEPGPTLFNPNMRHSAVMKRGSELWVFWTQVGHVPERILLSRIDITRRLEQLEGRPPYRDPPAGTQLGGRQCSPTHRQQEEIAMPDVAALSGFIERSAALAGERLEVENTGQVAEFSIFQPNPEKHR
jgi:hypothetical protein